ncbi:MAG: putative Ig domain-containing protein [Synergistaceae bacterium]|nr:putative Ig domain-containing protein [Synergistaceae bacterium]
MNISQDSEYNYTNYDLSVDISNLPDGFEVSGDKEFNNISFDSHDFTIYIKGLTNSSFTQDNIIISASVVVSGDNPVLITSADHNISINIAAGILTSSTLSVNDSAIEGVFTEKFAPSMDLSGVVSDVTGNFSDGTSQSIKNSSTITFSSSSLPDEFTIDGSILQISESAAAGSYDISITATANNNGITSSGTKNISVSLYSYPTITINTSEIAAGKIGENYSQTFTASAIVNNSDASITPTWILENGTLPAGLVLNSEGTISGTPTQSGSFDINIKVSADVTTVDNHNIIISADKEFILSIIASEDFNIQIVSCEVTLSGNNEITLTEGTGGSLTFTPVVSAHYSDGSERLLTPGEYSYTWTINENFLTIYRMSFNNGTLTISENTPADKYNIAATINISVNNLTASASKYFNVVIESKSGAQSKDFIIDVGGDGESVTLTINNNSGNPVESLADITNKLSQAEKELITEIDLNNNTTIKDLAGITEFKNLSSLNAGGCESLKEVDVRGCNKLEYLDVSSCDIEILLVDGCESLRELICGNNLIETLDLSTCPNLEVLDCQANNLSELNIESNNLLIEIDCSYNNLPALDIAESFFTLLNNLICNGQEISGVNAELDGDVYRININTLGNVSNSDIEISANPSTSAIMPDKIYNVKAYNNAGEEIIINYDSKTGIFESSQQPASIKYYYITGFENIDMDVTLQITGEDPAPTPTPTPDNQFTSGGGCNSAFGLISLMALAMFRRKK